MPDPEDTLRKLLAVVGGRVPGHFGFNPMRDVQVLCPINRDSLSARMINIEPQRALNPPDPEQVEYFGWTLGPGDKAMQVANNYERDVFNGDLGLVTGLDMEEGTLTVGSEGRDVEYGFGIGFVRGKWLVVIVGNRKALAMAVRNCGARRGHAIGRARLHGSWNGSGTLAPDGLSQLN